MAASVCGEETMEKIYVAVRLRPLNEREIGRNDVSDWECINNTTVIFKNTLQERPLLPTAYTFDRVFGYNSHTRQVYEEAAMKVALSVLSGINSTIFAYGQTGSGKTFTMCGITEYAIADIYDYIHKHSERNFVLKFSAMEIYNEAVKDPLRSDGTQLRLLDDPERGTVVDKLTEVKLRDSNHLKELLSICAAQRQIGETSLNEHSSRSHQILRLTVESEARHYLGADNSSSTLTASVNFVDLAGSERASQTLSAGTRLKEGCHINRSLLTLGTVIRKLSKGRNGHIPYRDSKLTRILQNSLGGNARTAIICTMSPARTHVEQSRNTLHFANCAKQVSTNAQVNVVMSEKALVKQLQRELARLMNELRTLTSHSASADKEQLIHKMEKEINELTLQRDQAHARVEDVLRECQTPTSWVYMHHHHDRGSWTDGYSSPSEASEIMDPLRFDVASRTSHLSEIPSRIGEEHFLSEIPSRIQEEQFLSDDTSPRLYIDKYFGPDPCQGWEKITMQQTNNYFEENTCKDKEVQCIDQEISDFTKTKSNAPSPPQHSRAASTGKLSPRNKDAASKKSKSCEAIPTTLIMDSPTTPPQAEDNILDDKEAELEIKSQLSMRLNEEEEEDSCVKQVIESKPVDSVSSLGVRKAEEIEDSKALKQSADLDWNSEFERQKREIIKLWDACGTPLVHRSYFLLLFKGDPSDAVYLEVELRRLSFLNNSMHGVGVGVDEQLLRKVSSIKSLNREREMLSRRLLRKYSAKEREALYHKWGIDVKSKQRRVQLCRKLWSDPTDMERIHESACIVAKLVGFKEQGEAPKEMFGLSLLPKHSTPRSFTWSSII
ncbi:hypothetical protein ACS0TY_013828 [Phlomoides rotata]